MLQHLLAFVEEMSMEVVLEQLLPPLLGAASFEIHSFQCKNDLLTNLPSRLCAYRRWLPPHWAILVLLDRDDGDCHTLKQTLEGMTARAGLVSKSRAGQGNPFQVVNRIVIEELEAWFFGDWSAVRTAYPRLPVTVPQQTRFRNPDAIAGGTWESLERILRRSGYFKTGLRKLECAKAVAQHMDPTHNRSGSFQHFAGAISAARLWI
ncbi:MAG: DUF4276 family protein [Magnetococcus sp. DMHC-8]